MRGRGVKLTADQVAMIRQMEGTRSQAAIGLRFGVSQKQVSNILRGKAY